MPKFQVLAYQNMYSETEIEAESADEVLQKFAQLNSAGVVNWRNGDDDAEISAVLNENGQGIELGDD